jgi:hypothetical protein
MGCTPLSSHLAAKKNARKRQRERETEREREDEECEKQFSEWLEDENDPGHFVHHQHFDAKKMDKSVCLFVFKS